MLQTETAAVRPEAACRAPLSLAADVVGRPLLDDVDEFSWGGGAAPEGAALGAGGVLLFDRRMEPEDWPFPVGACPPEYVL
jgi:hypothetical protein